MPPMSSNWTPAAVKYAGPVRDESVRAQESRERPRRSA